MATFYGTRGAANFPVPQAVGGGVKNTHWSSYTFLANPTAADVVRMLTLPARCTVIDGLVYGVDLDTGTDALDIDLGWQANGVEAADPDGFGNMGVWNGAAITNLKPEVGLYRPLGGVLFTTGPQFFTAETNIIFTVNVTANAGGTGLINLVVNYVCL